MTIGPSPVSWDAMLTPPGASAYIVTGRFSSGSNRVLAGPGCPGGVGGAEMGGDNTRTPAPDLFTSDSLEVIIPAGYRSDSLLTGNGIPKC